MVLSDFKIKNMVENAQPLITPFIAQKESFGGVSRGLSSAGYDVTLGTEFVRFLENVRHEPVFPNSSFDPSQFKRITREIGFVPIFKNELLLCHTVEVISIPVDVVGVVHDKSTFARLGLAVQNTVLEPGWSGQVTLELTNHGPSTIMLPVHGGIAQVVFHTLTEPSSSPYDGKYNEQRGVVLPRKSEE